jgi:hypothetical protein
MLFEPDYELLYYKYKTKYINLKYINSIGGGAGYFEKLGYSKENAKLYADNLNDATEEKIKEMVKIGISASEDIYIITSNLVNKLEETKKSKLDKTLKKQNITYYETEIMRKLNNLLYLNQTKPFNKANFFLTYPSYVNKINGTAESGMFKKGVDMSKDLIFVSNKIYIDDLKWYVTLTEPQLKLLSDLKNIKTKLNKYIDTSTLNAILRFFPEGLNEKELEVLFHMISIGYNLYKPSYLHYVKRFSNNIDLFKQLTSLQIASTDLQDKYNFILTLHNNIENSEVKDKDHISLYKLSDQEIKTVMELAVLFNQSINNKFTLKELLKKSKTLTGDSNTVLYKSFIDIIKYLKQKNINVGNAFYINEKSKDDMIYLLDNGYEFNKVKIMLENLSGNINNGELHVFVNILKQIKLYNPENTDFIEVYKFIKNIMEKISNNINNEKLKQFIELYNKDLFYIEVNYAPTSSFSDISKKMPEAFINKFAEVMNDTTKLKWFIEYTNKKINKINIKFEDFLQLSDEEKSKK